MDRWHGKQLLILGLARQGTALAQFGVGVGARVVVSDLRVPDQLAEAVAELDSLPITFVLGEHPMSLLDNADVVAVSGGVPADAPLVREARRRGIEITNDSQEFFRRAPATVVGITGSAGKTTTTALTGLMGQMAGRPTWVGGNIGRPLIVDVHKMGAEDLVVQELSSFQLEIWTLSPPVAAILNITPNHLDRHKSMAAYANAKGNILRNQGPDGVAILSADDPGSRAMAPLARGRLRWFSRNRPVTDGAFVRNDAIWLTDGEAEQQICSLSDIPLRGAHNVSNVLAAVVLADSAQIPPDAMRRAIGAFRGVEHRLETVATVNGVQYVNDSIATSPERAIAALQSFREPIVLLAGGRDKEMVWDEWAAQVRRRARAVILFGELGPALAAKLQNGSGVRSVSEVRPLQLVQAEGLEEAVRAATEVAEAGDVVLLAPGGTSFDAFADFAARGERFRQLVDALKQDA